MNLVKLFSSFKRAFSGISKAFKEEQNFQIQFFFGLIVVIVSLLLRVRLLHFVILFFAISLMLILELINTAIERIVDIIHPRVHQYAAMIKDMMAAAVLLSAMVCCIIVVVVLYPYILNFFD